MCITHVPSCPMLTTEHRCLATPCHTQDSICYYVTSSSSSHPGGVFTGDTLFIAGCGRFFEGTADEMHAALSYLGTLPAQTVVYNGHEYTAGNVAFAKSVDAENPALKRLDGIVSANKIVTGLTTIADEKEWNPFMRLNTAPIQCVVAHLTDVVNLLFRRSATGASSDSAVMDKLRTMKNNFRG